MILTGCEGLSKCFDVVFRYVFPVIDMGFGLFHLFFNLRVIRYFAVGLHIAELLEHVSGAEQNTE